MKVLSCEYCEIFKISFFTEHLLVIWQNNQSALLFSCWRSRKGWPCGGVILNISIDNCLLKKVIDKQEIQLSKASIVTL